ncbi:MAG TPA: hypothetical protein VLH08_02850 [Acidobacteriota bacterium]|nr:hypothetical protein [Acidobacteriota bacterium]
MIADRATFDKPHQFSIRMVPVFVNGIQVLKNGEHTCAHPRGSVARMQPLFKIRSETQ